MEELGWSQRRLAREIGVSAPTVGRLLAGSGSDKIVAGVARALELADPGALIASGEYDEWLALGQAVAERSQKKFQQTLHMLRTWVKAQEADEMLRESLARNESDRHDE